MSDARIDRLEARLAHIEQAIIRVEERLAVTLPHPATKAELADNPSRHYNWRLRGGNDRRHSAALAAGATGAIILTYLTHH